MPRPRKDDPRDCNLTIRFSVAERARLQRRATAAGSTVAAFARARVFSDGAADVTRKKGLCANRSADVEAGFRVVVRDVSTARLTEEIRRVGVNLNQMARRMNEHRHVDSAELQAALGELRACLRRVRTPAP